MSQQDFSTMNGEQIEIIRMAIKKLDPTIFTIENKIHPEFIFCTACEEIESDPVINEIYICDMCTTSVHQKCFGEDLLHFKDSFIMKSWLGVKNWFCQRCLLLMNMSPTDPKPAPIRCELCPEINMMLKYVNLQQQNELNKIQTWVHLSCLRRLNTTFEDDTYTIQQDYLQETHRCNMCSRTSGFRQQCGFKECQKHYHIGCAKVKGMIIHEYGMKLLRLLLVNQTKDDSNLNIFCLDHIQQNIQRVETDIGQEDAELIREHTITVMEYRKLLWYNFNHLHADRFGKKKKKAKAKPKKKKKIIKPTVNLDTNQQEKRIIKKINKKMSKKIISKINKGINKRIKQKQNNQQTKNELQKILKKEQSIHSDSPSIPKEQIKKTQNKNINGALQQNGLSLQQNELLLAQDKPGIEGLLLRVFQNQPQSRPDTYNQLQQLLSQVSYEQLLNSPDFYQLMSMGMTGNPDQTIPDTIGSELQPDHDPSTYDPIQAQAQAIQVMREFQIKQDVPIILEEEVIVPNLTLFQEQQRDIPQFKSKHLRAKLIRSYAQNLTNKDIMKNIENFSLKDNQLDLTIPKRYRNLRAEFEQQVKDNLQKQFMILKRDFLNLNKDDTLEQQGLFIKIDTDLCKFIFEEYHDIYNLKELDKFLFGYFCVNGLLDNTCESMNLNQKNSVAQFWNKKAKEMHISSTCQVGQFIQTLRVSFMRVESKFNEEKMTQRQLENIYAEGHEVNIIE